MKLDSLENLFLHEIRDLLSAEKQLVKALPKMAKGAANATLQDAFHEHLEQTKNQVQRLEQVFQIMGKPARAEQCKAMEGLIEEGAELLEEEGSEAVKDAAIIAAAQRVEHYEIAGYGSARTLTEMLHQEEAADLLQQTLDEEKETDRKLTEITMREIKPEIEEPMHAG